MANPNPTSTAVASPAAYTPASQQEFEWLVNAVQNLARITRADEHHPLDGVLSALTDIVIRYQEAHDVDE